MNATTLPLDVVYRKCIEMEEAMKAYSKEQQELHAKWLKEFEVEVETANWPVVYESLVQLGISPKKSACYCERGAIHGLCSCYFDPKWQKAVWTMLSLKEALLPLRQELLLDLRRGLRGERICAERNYALQLKTFLTETPKGWW